jgi:cytochrome c-type biogenesis protein CcmH/NrfG
LEKAVSLDPSRTKALYLLGRLYMANRDSQKAVPYLKRALQLQPNLNEASGLLGTAYAAWASSPMLFQISRRPPRRSFR